MNKLVALVGGGSGINVAYPFFFSSPCKFNYSYVNPHLSVPGLLHLKAVLGVDKHPVLPLHLLHELQLAGCPLHMGAVRLILGIVHFLNSARFCYTPVSTLKEWTFPNSTPTINYSRADLPTNWPVHAFVLLCVLLFSRPE